MNPIWQIADSIVQLFDFLPQFVGGRDDVGWFKNLDVVGKIAPLHWVQTFGQMNKNSICRPLNRLNCFFASLSSRS